MMSWNNPYGFDCVRRPYHRLQSVPWNNMLTGKSIVSNGFDFWESEAALDYIDDPDYWIELRALQTRAWMATSVIRNLYKRNLKNRIDKHKLVLVYAVRGKILDEHLPIIVGFLGKRQCQMYLRGDGLKALRRSAGKKMFYIKALFPPIECRPDIRPPSEYLCHPRYRCPTCEQGPHK